VVSPEFLQRNGIVPYEISDRNQFIQTLNQSYKNNIDSNYTQGQFDTFISTHKKNTILNSSEVSMPFVVIGSGITADFTYPILDIQHANPNPTNECIIFGNSHAYNRMFDAYRGNFTENYLVGTFNKGINQKETLNLMNKKAREIMSWPKDIQACYMASDTTNVLNAGAFRLAFIPSLVAKIKTIDIALTSFIAILSLFICAIIIQRYIGNNRTQIGVMQANGVSKGKITFSLIPFALLPAILGGFGGYLFGFFLQKPAVGLFSNYWMLPTPLASFNIWVLLFAILVPFLVFLSVSIIATFVQLREKTVNLMKTGSEFKSSFVVRHIKEPFRSFSIMTKFRISTAFNSIWKLIILSIMVAMSISTLVFGINVLGKFQYSESQTFASRNYSYAVDLYSPTEQGGQYVPVDADTLGETGFITSTDGIN
jgi:putative ABC transport system permease protein